MKLIDITGQRYGRLVVTAMLPNKKCECLCDCGNLSTPLRADVRKGHTTTCGCSKEHHGMSGSKEYMIWVSIIKRCCNPHDKDYERYGGRGITVCDEWRHSFEAFYKDMGARPDDCQTIDRINNNGNYEPGNCRWTTWKRQNRNTSRTIMIDYHGLSLPLCDVADLAGIPVGMLRRRYYDGWAIDRMLARA